MGIHEMIICDPFELDLRETDPDGIDIFKRMERIVVFTEVGFFADGFADLDRKLLPSRAYRTMDIEILERLADFEFLNFLNDMAHGSGGEGNCSRRQCDQQCVADKI